MALGAELVAQGVSIAVATPHRSEAYRPEAEVLRERLGELRAAVEAAGVPLQVSLGREVAISSALDLGAAEVEEMRMADSRWLLLEAPHGRLYPFGLSEMTERLHQQGIATILAHPERNRHVQAGGRIVSEHVARGGLSQVTATSLVGGFGNAAARSAWELLASGEAQIVASDCHGLESRAPRMAAARDLVEQRAGRAAADVLFREAPAAVLAGARAEDVPRVTWPAQRRGWRSRIRRR